MLNNICNGGVCDKVNNYTGGMRYAGKELKLNKYTELWIDEAQDLNEDYFNAIIILMLSTKIDVTAVGDMLQSLKFQNNFMTCCRFIHHIEIIREKPINENRRIKVNYMSEKINELIDF
jgi:hypothetical protein